MTNIKPRDIIRVTHYQSEFAGMLGEVREETSLGYYYVEFNDREGISQDGAILGAGQIEWVYRPNWEPVGDSA